MWLEDSDHLDRNAIRAALAEAPVRTAVRSRKRQVRGVGLSLAWLVGGKRQKAA